MRERETNQAGRQGRTEQSCNLSPAAVSLRRQGRAGQGRAGDGRVSLAPLFPKIGMEGGREGMKEKGRLTARR